MKNKAKIIIEIALVIVGFAYYTIFVMIPEYKSNRGSSDSFVHSGDYQNIIEIILDDTTDFAFVINSEGKIKHIFFFDNSSVVLYNRNIENMSIDKSLKEIFPILIENQLLKSGTSVQIIRDKDDFYSEFQNSWNSLIRKYSIQTDTFEKVESISVKAKKLGIDTENDTYMLLELDLYSKEMINNYKSDHVSILNQSTSVEYANTIYLKIEKLIRDKKITNLDRNHEEIQLSYIPADSKFSYYPTSRSWYYVVDGKVYAFIEFQEGSHYYSYCYRGSIDSRVEGECEA